MWLLLLAALASTTIAAPVSSPRPVAPDSTASSWAVVPLGFEIDSSVDFSKLRQFDYSLAKSLPFSERCLGFAFQQAQDPEHDEAFLTWSDWFADDASSAGLSREEASSRARRSIAEAADSLKTDKGVAAAAECRKYFDSWLTVRPPPIGAPQPK